MCAHQHYTSTPAIHIVLLSYSCLYNTHCSPPQYSLQQIAINFEQSLNVSEQFTCSPSINIILFFFNKLEEKYAKIHMNRSIFANCKCICICIYSNIYFLYLLFIYNNICLCIGVRYLPQIHLHFN